MLLDSEVTFQVKCISASITKLLVTERTLSLRPHLVPFEHKQNKSSSGGRPVVGLGRGVIAVTRTVNSTVELSEQWSDVNVELVKITPVSLVNVQLHT